MVAPADGCTYTKICVAPEYYFNYDLGKDKLIEFVPYEVPEGNAIPTVDDFEPDSSEPDPGESSSSVPDSRQVAPPGWTPPDTEGDDQVDEVEAGDNNRRLNSLSEALDQDQIDCN